jgi:hypothetical protein
MLFLYRHLGRLHTIEYHIIPMPPDAPKDQVDGHPHISTMHRGAGACSPPADQLSVSSGQPIQLAPSLKSSHPHLVWLPHSLAEGVVRSPTLGHKRGMPPGAGGHKPRRCNLSVVQQQFLETNQTKNLHLYGALVLPAKKPSYADLDEYKPSYVHLHTRTSSRSASRWMLLAGATKRRTPVWPPHPYPSDNPTIIAQRVLPSQSRHFLERPSLPRWGRCLPPCPY